MNKILLTLILLLPMLSMPASSSSKSSSRSSTSASNSKSTTRSTTPTIEPASAEQTKKDFATFLQSIPYPTFQNLICSGRYTDQVDWLCHFLEAKFSQTIFRRNADKSLDFYAFDEAFRQKNPNIKNLGKWTVEQLANYTQEFYDICYETFIQRATHEIIQNEKPWTQTVSVKNPDRNSLYKFLYPIYYSSGTFVAIENQPPLDTIHIVLTKIFLNVLNSKNYKKFLDLQPTCNLNLDSVTNPDVSNSYSYTNWSLSTKLFDQDHTQDISSICSTLQGYSIQCALPDGSLITNDDQHLYYYKFDALTNKLELYNSCQCNVDIDDLKAIHLSTDKNTLYAIEYDLQDKLFAWHFTVKNSVPKSKPIKITNLEYAKKIDPKLFDLLKTESLLELSQLQASDQFVVGAFKKHDVSTHILIILEKSTTKPEEFSLMQIIPPIEYDDSIQLFLHKRNNCLAVIDPYNNKIIIYQLSSKQRPKIVKTFQYPNISQDGAKTTTAQLIKTIYWASSGALFTVVTKNLQPKSKTLIQIFDSSTWEEKQKFYSSEDNPRVQISPNNQYCFYIQEKVPTTTTYVIQDLLNKKEVLSLTNNATLMPMVLHWNLNQTKNQLFCFTQSGIIDQATTTDITALDLNAIIDRAIPALIQNALSNYLFSLGQSPTAKAPMPINPLPTTATTTQEEINSHYAQESARYDQEYYECLKELIYNNNYAHTAQQSFLLGQLFFEDNQQAFNELGGFTWLAAQPEDIQNIMIQLPTVQESATAPAKTISIRNKTSQP